MQQTYLRLIFLCSLLIFIQQCNKTDAQIFRNLSVSIKKRLDDLISSLTIEELVEQMANGGAGPTYGPAPAIPRLKIKPYQWRTNPNQGLCTSFVSHINQAASFDILDVWKIAFANGLEMRAKWNQFSKQNNYRDNTGINVFAPTVNLLRHPLWGRNKETYGEDPYLAAELARAYVHGISGWNVPHDGSIKVNLLTINPIRQHVVLVGANCKHYAAHSGPENDPVSRLSFEADVPEHDLWMTYFPAFRACMEAGAVGVMCAYSGVNGTPACVNHWLLDTVLRKQWKYPGFVISDEGALQFLISKHHVYSSLQEAALAAVKAGVNIENALPNNVNVYSELLNLTKSGNVTEDELRNLVRPLFLARILEGELNSPEMDPYAHLLPSTVVKSEKHKYLSLVTAAKTMVLLKNSEEFLPLKMKPDTNERPLKHVALLGPFSRNISELVGSYTKHIDPADTVPLDKTLEKISENVTASDICIDGGKCTMYDDLAIQEILSQPDIDLVIITIGTGRNVEDEAHDRHNLNLPGHQNEFLLSTLDMAAGRGIIRRKPVPVVLLVFSSGPIDIEPAVEDENVKSIFWCGYMNDILGEVIVRVLMGNPGKPFGPYAPLLRLDPELSEIGMWGMDIDEGYWWVPAARLPFTWYASIDELANITVYKMTNQTYRYLPRSCTKQQNACKIPILYPFGYGLSYNMLSPSLSGIEYLELELPLSPVKPNQPITVYATVANEGDIACEEVVQLYIQWLKCGQTDITNEDQWECTAPNIQLAGFKRIRLDVGEKKDLHFQISPDQLSVWSNQHKSMVPGQGTLRISVGGQQPDQPVTVGSNYLIGIVKIDHI
ncbi:unnamed protein product [Schistosoma haematobium]|nr:unnamed protein product [Schistosoma haematobium]CAH8669239.1 unnamed protein product [Schistosoma haematobium]